MATVRFYCAIPASRRHCSGVPAPDARSLPGEELRPIALEWTIAPWIFADLIQVLEQMITNWRGGHLEVADEVGTVTALPVGHSL